MAVQFVAWYIQRADNLVRVVILHSHLKLLNLKNNPRLVGLFLHTKRPAIKTGQLIPYHVFYDTILTLCTYAKSAWPRDKAAPTSLT